MKSVPMLAVLLVSLALLFSGCVSPKTYTIPQQPTHTANSTYTPGAQATGNLSHFSSWDELSDFLKSASSGSGYGYRGGMIAASGATKDMVLSVAPTASPESNAQSSTDYSQTNVQVQGVDEADLVKNDGKYVYIVKNEYGTSIRYNPFSSGSTGKVKIIDAYPAASMKQVGEISIDGDVQQIFVNGDKLVVFGSVYVPYYFPSGLSSDAVCLRCVVPPYYSSNFAFMRIYDISDKASPKLLKRIEVKGNYVESRMIGSKVYTVFSDYASYDYPMPLYRVDGQEMKIAPTDVGYFDFPDSGYSFNILSGVDLSDLASADSRKVVLMGGAQNLFVSSDNLYVTYSRYDYYDPMWRVYNEVLSPYFDDGMKKRVSEIDAMNISGWRKERLKSQEAISFMQGKIFNPLDWSIDTNLREEIQQKIYDGQQKTTEQPRNSENTAIHKFALDSAFTYGGQAEVPGHALNQFSMDEYNGTFRIATTVGQSWNANPPSSNGIYVFDSSLKQIGKLEGLAKGESIYSARFMGARAYLVTFKKTDPLFVIGLSDPTNPEVLGKLKIPGYSDYLHPYDETHLIGLGKGAVADENGGNFAWYQGVKLSLFDVSDVEHPKEVAYYEIGDRGTDSYALSEHKAFLFSKEKNLLVIPITLAKIDPLKYPSGVPANTYGDYVFQGAYVFSITPEKGFALRGTISHVDEAEYKKSGDYWWSNNNVVRSLYIGEYLYTLSDLYLKANDLGTLVPVSSVQVGQNQTYRGGYYYE